MKEFVLKLLVFFGFWLVFIVIVGWKIPLYLYPAQDIEFIYAVPIGIFLGLLFGPLIANAIVIRIWPR